MKKLVQFSLIFFVSIFWISGCNFGSTQDASTNVSDQDPGIEEQDEVAALLEVVLLDNSEYSAKTDVYIKNLDSGDMNLFITLTDVAREHGHNAEYNNGSLFIILEIGYDGYPDDDWTNELWRYSETGEGVKLYSSQGMNFRAAPNGEIIGLETQGKLVFVDPSGNVLQEISASALFPDFEFDHISLEKWSDDSSIFWVSAKFGPSPLYFSKVSVGSWQITTYQTQGLSLGREFDLNPNTGKLVYSDHPVFFEVEGATQFAESKTAVSLFLYDLDTKEEVQIAISVAQPFDPKWLDDLTIEYNNPGGEDRLTYTLP